MSYSRPAKISLKKDSEYDSLSFEQKIIFELAVFQHKNIFITGQAGSGKSHLLRMIIAAMKRVYTSTQLEKVVVTSMTGVAALNISGSTLHSAIGLNSVPITDEDLKNQSKLQDKIFKKQISQQTKERIQDMHVLIIDEVSMLSSYVLDAMNIHFQKIRKNKKLFGGVQMILCGDFMQLPPVEKQISQKVFLFKSEAFQKLDFKIQLIQQFRQLHDNSFNQILLKIRNNNIDNQVKCALGSRFKSEQQVNKEQDDEKKRIEEQFKADIQKLKNKYQYYLQKLDQLGTKISNFKQQNDVVNIDDHINNIRQMCKYYRLVHETVQSINKQKMIEPQFPIRLYPKNNEVKQYNEEMLKKNCKGKIYSINADDYSQNQAEIGEKVFQVDKQLQLTVGTQIMICKNIDVKGNIVNGSVGYVESIDFKGESKQSQIDNINYYELNAVQNEVVIYVNIYEGGMADNTKQQIKRVALKPYKFEIKTANDRIQASRMQIPLTLAYALTIHKSQGITLSRAVINLKHPFGDGMVYVALSRLKSLDGLILTGIQYDKIQISKECVDFYNNINKIDLNDISIIQTLKNVWQDQTPNLLNSDRDQTVLSNDLEQILKERNIKYNITPLVSRSQRFQSKSQNTSEVIIPIPNSQQQSQPSVSPQSSIRNNVTSSQQRSSPQSTTQLRQHQQNAQLQLYARQIQTQNAILLSQRQQQNSNTQHIEQQQHQQRNNVQSQNRDQSIISISSSTEASVTESVNSETSMVAPNQNSEIDTQNTANESSVTYRSLNEQRYYVALLNNITNNH